MRRAALSAALSAAIALCLVAAPWGLAAACTVTVGTPELVSGPTGGTLLPDAYTAVRGAWFFCMRENKERITSQSLKAESSWGAKLH
jgi:hypothetical protein